MTTAKTCQHNLDTAAEPVEGSPEHVRSVLVATDLGPTGRRGIEFALALLPEGGRLVLLHVDVPLGLPTATGASYAPVPLPAEERSGYRARIQADLVKSVSSRNRRLDLEVEVVEATDVAQAIVGAAERHGVDLVCLGTHQFGRMTTALLGSIARVVARRSSRPVLLVPPPTRKPITPGA